MGAPEKSQGNSNSMQRVKVYRLSEDGKWDDQGTGHVTVDYLERSEEPALFVFDEEDNATLLLHRIRPDDIYRKQEDTIISWRDSEFSTELALSFQENTGCSYVWDHICNAQRNMHFSSLNNEIFHTMNSELRDLPAVELSTLPIILKTVTESGLADQIRLTELILNDQDFFQKLMELFRICEDLENMDGLHMIFKIIKGIILLNSPQIFEKIFGDELIMDIIGSLEYDPDVPQVQHYRVFLKEHVVFKVAIPIKNPLALSKIHQTYRIGYLKDVVLARILDEATAASLNSIIHSNNAIVISILKDDSTFIQELFARLRSPTTSTESKKKLVNFLHEFCNLSKNLQMVQLHRLFRDFINEGIFNIIADVLQSSDKKLVLTGTDILILFLNQDPNLLRSYVVRQEGIPLLGLLVKGMVTDFGEAMHCQFLEILRSLLDSFSLSGAQRDTIIDIFYEKHLGQLIDVIILACSSDEAGQSTCKSTRNAGRVESQNNTKPEILLSICELLCFCVLHHPYGIKCNFLLNNVIDKVLLLTRRREKYLVVAAVRFVRTILSRHDEHLINHFVKNNLLKPIIDAFVANGNRYNVMNSAVLELFEYIRKENLKLLVRYVVDSFWDQLVKFEKLASVHSLKVKYEQCSEDSGPKTNVNAPDPRKRIDERALEKEEEDYFNEDSDEDDTASASRPQKVQSQPVSSNGVVASQSSSSLRSGGLVDYDDEEDYKPPPPRKQIETSEEDEGTMESLRLKRKPNPKEQEFVKKQRLGKSSKSKGSVFAALCSTLSQAVLPSKKTANAMNVSTQSAEGNKDSDEENHLEKESISPRDSDGSSSEEDNHKEKEPPRNCSDHLHSPTDNRQLSGEDSSLIPPKSSPEMAVNGS
ncbi:Serine/threonine-protein phosphatase 4 regulatory subunit 3 isoform 2 [Hibiscus syriacus]|uniref:Serine/threonine-protein phosphatase 4 regulatory subunit 3 isoform 2 n=1 Tax=Hibiscus syriacus TaxID=106335 RepID=A0A6A3A337_HIBSY|nr:serine/threonine-protein phosphatase 4 regulatory subunit 3-like [Hibiscus syriacus]KAE8698226.1 Serine/threonine-protein phosphatase 4 regulatory subunit 3 isoform 2 [Hibiscus syriacus]